MAVRRVADRARSPRYPSLPLSKAMELAERVYRGIHRSTVDSITIIKEMGFAGRSGASATALGTLRQFGLIQGYADETKISDLALSIFEPLSPSERIASLVEAAKNPTVFGQIFERFGGSLPNSNEALRAFLVRELGFNSNSASECVAALRETLAYVESLKDVSTQAEVPAPGRPAESGPAVTDFGDGATARKVHSASEMFSFRLSKDCRVELRFEGQITESALSGLVKYVELMRDSLES